MKVLLNVDWLDLKIIHCQISSFIPQVNFHETQNFLAHKFSLSSQVHDMDFTLRCDSARNLLIPLIEVQILSTLVTMPV